MNIITIHAGLHLAAEAGSSESVSALLSSGADPNLTDMVARRTPIFLAAQNGHRDCIQSVSDSYFLGPPKKIRHKKKRCSQLGL